jgi:hypothetical protein
LFVANAADRIGLDVRSGVSLAFLKALRIVKDVATCCSACTSFVI